MTRRVAIDCHYFRLGKRKSTHNARRRICSYSLGQLPVGRTYSGLVSEGTIRLELLVVPWSPSMLLGSSCRRVWAKHGAESENEAE